MKNRLGLLFRLEKKEENENRINKFRKYRLLGKISNVSKSNCTYTKIYAEKLLLEKNLSGERGLKKENRKKKIDRKSFTSKKPKAKTSFAIVTKSLERSRKRRHLKFRKRTVYL